MKLHVHEILREYSNKEEHFKRFKFEDMAPFIEKAMEEDLKELFNIFGINGHPKKTQVSNNYQLITISEKYRALWLTEGYSRFEGFFYKIMKELFYKKINKLRFNVSLTITKAESKNFVGDFYYFEFHFKYFGNNSRNDYNSA